MYVYEDYKQSDRQNLESCARIQNCLLLAVKMDASTISRQQQKQQHSLDKIPL